MVEVKALEEAEPEADVYAEVVGVEEMVVAEEEEGDDDLEEEMVEEEMVDEAYDVIVLEVE